MRFLFAWLAAFFQYCKWTPKGRRARYDFLKNEVCKRHFDGYAGLTIHYPIRFDRKDLASFKPPMYAIVKNQDHRYCLFWDRSRLTQEIGTGAPLKDGEVAISDHSGRTKPDATLESINVQRPLVTTSG